MPVATIPGLWNRSSVAEIVEPALTQDDADIVVDRFEIGAGEIRYGYVTPSPYTGVRYRDESLEELNEQFPIGGAAPPARAEVKLLPHAKEEQEAGRNRLEQLGPAIEAVDEYQREQGIELPAERAARWQEDVESLKGQDLPIEEASRRLAEGRVNRTEQDATPVGEDDYESSGGGSGAGARTKQAGSAGKPKSKPGRPAGSANQSAEQARAAEARQKAQDARKHE